MKVIVKLELSPHLRLVNLEVVVVIVCLVLMRVHTHLVCIVTICYRGIDSDLAVILVIHRAYLKAIFRAT